MIRENLPTFLTKAVLRFWLLFLSWYFVVLMFVKG
jgi:hypothetical protein